MPERYQNERRERRSTKIIKIRGVMAYEVIRHGRSTNWFVEWRDVYEPVWILVHRDSRSGPVGGMYFPFSPATTRYLSDRQKRMCVEIFRAMAGPS